MTETLFRDAYELHRAGKWTEAARLYGEILKTQPRHFQAAYLLGFSYFQQDALTQADTWLARALDIDPHAVDALCSHGAVLHRLGKIQEGLARFEQALTLAPDLERALFGAASAALQLGRTADAFAYIGRALAVNPRNAAAWEDRAYLALQLRRPQDAFDAYDKALTFKPGDIALLYGRANAASILGRFEDAIRDCEAVLARDPDYEFARGILVHCKLHGCDWRELDAERENITRALNEHRAAISPFDHKALSDSPEEQLRCAEIWAARTCPTAQIALWRGETYHHARIRVAYLSADFTNSALAHVMAGVFAHHDRAQFEISAFSFGVDRESPARTRLEAAFEHFHDVAEHSDAAIAELLRAREIDIAVDLMGFTGACRSAILAYRPAPVQVNYLGFPGTMGEAHMDYILADPTLVPEAARGCYRENMALLPESFLPRDDSHPAPPARPARSTLGLPENGFVFCCFNNSYKFSPAMFDIWMRLLREVPGSVLWLPQNNPTAQRHLTLEAGHRAIAPERLVFAPKIMDPQAHLARLAAADLFLDTLPYNAHTTASDALWAGLPVLTCAGRGFAARVAASLLTAAGLPELIVDTPDAYEATALRLAREPRTLAALRRTLAHNRDALFDTARFTRRLEAAFAHMGARAREGLAPAPFAIGMDGAVRAFAP